MVTMRLMTTPRKSPSKASKKTSKTASKGNVGSNSPSKTTSKEIVISEPASKKASKKVSKTTLSNVAEKSKNKSDSLDNDDLEDPLKVKCRPLNLVKLIEGLSVDKKEAIRSIGFGGMLELHLTKLPKKILPWFIHAFGNRSHMFKANEQTSFLLTKYDVHDFFKISIGPQPLELVGTGPGKLSQQDDAIEVKRLWRERFGVKDVSKGINLGEIDRMLREIKDPTDDFKRLFVLYCMSIFLAPTSNSYVDMHLLKAVENVDLISQYDWCSYVFDKTVDGFAKVKSGMTTVTGCVPFVMISYFHRFAFKGNDCLSDLPLIQHWTNATLKTRADDEFVTGSFGTAPLSKVVYPISYNNTSANQGQTHGELPNCVKSSKKCLMLELPSDVEDDSELQAKSIDETHLLFLMIKRDSEVFHARYCKHMSEIKSGINSSDLSKLDHSMDADVEMTPTQAFYVDPDLHRYIDEVVQIAKDLQKAARNMPSFESLSQIPRENYMQKAKVNVPSCKTKENKETPVFAYEQGNIGKSLDEIHPENIIGNILDDINMGELDENNAQYIPCSTMSNHPYLLHSEKPLSCMVVVPENLGCTYNCGAPDVDHPVVSKFILEQ